MAGRGIMCRVGRAAALGVALLALAFIPAQQAAAQAPDLAIPAAPIVQNLTPDSSGEYLLTDADFRLEATVTNTGGRADNVTLSAYRIQGDTALAGSAPPSGISACAADTAALCREFTETSVGGGIFGDGSSTISVSRSFPEPASSTSLLPPPSEPGLYQYYVCITDTGESASTLSDNCSPSVAARVAPPSPDVVPGDGSTTVRLDVPGTLTGTIDDIDDQDAYLVALVVGGIYQFDAVAAGSSTLDTSLGVYRPGHGNFVGVTTQSCHDSTGVLGGNDDIGGGSTDSQVTYTATQSGDHVLCVDAFAGTGNSQATSGDYQLTAAVTSEPPAPDLAATSVAFPSSLPTTEESGVAVTTLTSRQAGLTLNVEVANAAADATAAMIQVYRSPTVVVAGSPPTASGCGADNVLCAAGSPRTVGAFASGDTTPQASGTFTASADPGLYHYFACFTDAAETATLDDNCAPSIPARIPEPVALAFPGPEPVVADQLYLTTETISVTLPEAIGGSGSYAYTLADGDGNLPGGLAFDAATRVLSGTPDTVDTGVEHTYTVTDTSTPPMMASVNFDIAVARVRLAIAGDLEGRITTSDVNLLNAGGTGTRRLTGTLTLNANVTSFSALGGGFGNYGLFTIDRTTGVWAYNAGLFGGQLRRIRALLPGQVAYETRRVRATDEDGFTVDSEVIIILTGANNRPNPSITSPVSSATTVAAGAVVAVEGTVVDTDDMSADLPPAPTVLWSTNPPMGTFADPAALATTWSVTPPATATDIELILMVTDAGGLSNTATTTLTLHPTNAFSGVTTGAVTEDDNPVASGALMVLQAGGTLTVAGGVTARTDAACTNGVFDIDAAGAWTYEVDNALDAVQGLGAGETLVDVCPVAATDTSLIPATVNVAITITGVNDAPTVTVVASSPIGIGRSVALGDELNPGGVLTLTATAVDPDANDALTFAWTEMPRVSAVNPGSFSDATAATTTWTAPASIPSTYTTDLMVTVSDGATSASQTFAISLADNVLVFTASIPDQAYQQGVAIPDLTLPEATGEGLNGGSTATAYALDPVPAGLTFDADTRILSGTPTDALEPACPPSSCRPRVLGGTSGNPTGSTHTYTATDGDTSISLTFFISARDNIPTFAVTEIPDQDYTVNVPIEPLTLPEASGGDAALSYTLVGIRPCNCAPLLVLPTGLVFDAGTRVLSGTPTVSQPTTTHRYFVVDNDDDGNVDLVPLDFLITVVGAELEITGDLTGAVTEDDPARNTATGTVAISSTDPATATTFVAQTDAASTLGTFSITENGVWTYTLDNTNGLTQALSMGVMTGDVLTIMGTAGITRDINIVVTGANDQPTAAISAPTAGTTVGFGGEVTVTGSGSDPDTSDVLSYTWSTEPPGRGSFADAAASTTWTAPNSGTEAVTLVLTVTDSANPPGSATAQVSGFMPQAEAATIDTGGDRAGSVVEDDPAMNTATGTLTVTNTDGGSTDVVVQTPGTGTGTYGGLSFIGSVWTYTLDNDDDDTNALAAGDTVTETFTVTAAANPGSTAMIAITITGANDAPVADAGPDQPAVARSATVTLDGSASADPDTGADPANADAIESYAWTQSSGTDVTLDDAAVVSPTFTAPNSAGDLVFSLLVNDGTADSAPATVTITVIDAPSATISATTPATLTEANLDGATLTVTLTSTTYANPLPADPITLDTAATTAGVTATAVRDSATEATLTLAFDRAASDFDTDLDITVTVAAAAHANAGDLDAGTVTATAIDESDVATLAALTLSGGATLTPDFDAGTFTYTADVGNSVANIMVTPTATDATGATITVNGDAVTSGSASTAITLTAGMATDIDVLVTAEDGSTTRTYNLAVTRAAAPTAAISDTVPDSLTEANLNGAMLTVTLTGTTYDDPLPANPVTLNTAATTAGVTVMTAVRVSATEATLTLAFDRAVSDFDTDLDIIVTVAAAAHAGTGDLDTGTVTVTAVAENNNADLSALALSAGALTPDFDAATISYTAMVDNSVSSLTLTPTVANVGATITVAGTAVASGMASGSVDLDEGPNAIDVVVTATDGSTTQTYTVTVTRAAASGAAGARILATNPSPLTEANLDGATVTITLFNTEYVVAGSLEAAQFVATDTLSGTVTVSMVSRTDATNAVLTLAYDGTDFDTDGFISFNILAAAYTGTGSLPVLIGATGPAATLLPVTAVIENNNANLSALTLSAGTLTPDFDAATTSYTAMVDNSVSSLTLTPTVANAFATITVAGEAVASGTASGSVELAEGPNPIAVEVTATDDTTTQTYTVTVTRAAALALSFGGETIAAQTYTVNTVIPNLTLPVATGGTAPYSYALSDMPSGLTFDDTTRVLSGNPTTGQSATDYTYTATDSDATNPDTVELTFSIAITTPSDATLTATNPDPLVENTLDGATLEITLTGVTWVDSLSRLSFSIIATGTGFGLPSLIRVASVSRDSDTQATLTLGYGGADFDAPASFSVSIGAAAHSGSDGLNLNNIPITAVVENNDASLSALTLSGGVLLAPPFAADTLAYAATVADTVTDIMVTPTATNDFATIRVLGNAVANGTPSAAITLPVDTTTDITILVTATDGTTTQTYTLAVTRLAAPPPDITARPIATGTNEVTVTFSAPVNVAASGEANFASSALNKGMATSDERWLFFGVVPTEPTTIEPNADGTAVIITLLRRSGLDILPAPLLSTGSFISLTPRDAPTVITAATGPARVIGFSVRLSPPNISFAGDTTGEVTEDAATNTAGGTVTATNPGNGNTVDIVPITDRAGTYGAFTIVAGGAWTYTLNNADTDTNALTGDAMETETFTIASVAGRSQDIVITVTGANDAPTVTISAPLNNAQVVFDATVTLTATGADVDTGTTLSYEWTASPNVGSFGDVADASTTWTVPASGTDSVTLTLTATDDATPPLNGTAEVTVNPVAVAVTFAGATTGAVTEGAVAPITGTLTVSSTGSISSTDVVAQTDMRGMYGTFSIEAGGDWSYTLDDDNANAALNALPAGDEQPDTFTVVAAASASAIVDVTITVTGANDAPTVTISAPADGADAEFGTAVTLTATGADPDTGQTATLTYAWTASPNVGSFGDANAASTTWTAPASGTDSVTLTLTATDDATPALTGMAEVIVNPVAVAVTFAGVTTGDVDEGDATPITGTLTATTSAGTTTVVAQTDVSGTYGTFSIEANGAWSYTLDNSNVAIDALAVGMTLSDAFTVAAASATVDVVITITGVNDAPTVTISAPAGATDAEFGTAVTLTATGADVDTGTTLSYAWSATPNVGSFAAATDASTTWTAPASGTDPVTLTLTVTDDATPSLSGTAEVTVNPVAPAVTLGGETTGAVTEDAGTTTATGALTITTTSTNQNVVAQTDQPGTYGSFSITDPGVWTYDLDNADPDTNALPAGDEQTDTFTVTASANPASTVDVVITITGANDAPLADAGPDQSAVALNATVTLDGSASADPDTGDTIDTYTWTLSSGTGATLNDPSAVRPTFTAPGSPATLVFSLVVNDGDADSAPATVTITVTDAPAATISATSPGTLTEDTLNSATLTVTLVNTTYAVTPTIGQFTLTTTGITGVTVSGVTRDGNTEATLTLDFDRAANDFDANASLTVTVLDAAHTEAGDLLTASVTVEAINESNVATLADLTLSGSVPLNETFAPATLTYTADVAASVAEIMVTPTATDDTGATITVNGNAVNSGAASIAIALTAGGDTDITVVVTAEDLSTTQTYILTVTRAAATTPSAAIASPDSLTEAALDGATVTVMLTNTEYVPGTLTANLFTVTLSGGATGVSVNTAVRTSAVLATLTLAYGGTGIDTNTNLGIRVGAAGHSGAGDLDTATTIPVTATPPPGGAPTFGAATIPAQTYTMGSAITDLTLPVASGGTGTLSYSLSGMPSGLNFDAGTRVLSGTPDTAQAVTTYIYTATDSAVSPAAVTLSLVITVESGSGVIGGPLEGARSEAMEMTLGAFGRSFTSSAVEVLGERFSSGAGGSQLTFGGRTLSLESLTNDQAAANAGAGADNQPVPAAAGGQQTSVGALFAGSAFQLSLNEGNAAGVGATTLWARGSVGNYEGEPEDGFQLDGDIVSGYLGLDYRASRRTLVGVAVSHSRGDADFSSAAIADGEVETDLTSILPYVQWQPRAGLSVWGLVGYGLGESEITDSGESRKTDVEMQTAALGARGKLWSGGRADVALKASALTVEIESDSEQNLSSVSTSAHRLRMALEGKRHGAASARGGRFGQRFELGLRWDLGDVETGAGADLGAGVEYANPRSGTRLRLDGHYLLVHEETDFEEWEVSAEVGITPSLWGRGVTFALQPGWDSAGARQRMVMDFTDMLGPAWRGDGLKLELYGEHAEDHEFGLEGSVRY